MSCQISVVVLTYNATYADIEHTILSIINQKKIEYEIIVADDGSKENYFENIHDLFKRKSFNNYQLMSSDINRGTCINYYNAIKMAKGEFIKPISPQDFFFDENSLFNWYNYMKKNNIQVSFGNAVYYEKVDNKMVICQRNSTKPTLVSLYKIDNYRKKEIFIDNLILNDCILGASYICSRELLMKYLPQLLEKVKLCEDFVYRLMLLDDIKICFYDNAVIYYCYGTGVSAKKKSDGSSILHDDELAFKKLISKLSDKKNKRIIKFLSIDFNNRYINRIMSFVYFPIAIKLKVRTKINIILGKAKTSIEFNTSFLNTIGIESINKPNE